MFGAKKNQSDRQSENQLGQADFKRYEEYHLNSEYLEKQPIKFGSEDTDTDELEPIKFSEVDAWLRKQSITDVSVFLNMSITTESGEYQVVADSNILRIIEANVKLIKLGENIRNTTWYFVDVDSHLEEPRFSYSFFVTVGKKIVLEEVSLFYGYDHKYEGNLFLEPDQHPIWSNEPEFRLAFAIWMNQKFFRETDRGQIQAIVDSFRERKQQV